MATSESGTHVSTTSIFSSLLEQSRRLRQETETADLPSIQLSLAEIERRAKSLKSGQAGRQTDARARYLLAAGGINTDENLRDLDTIDFQTSFEPSVPVDTDIESYLRIRRDQNVASSIEDGMRRTARDFDTFVAKNVEMNWEDQKQKIFEHFGLAPRCSGSPREENFSASGFGRSGFGRSTRLGGSVGPGHGVSTNSAWAKSTMGSSVLGRSVARQSQYDQPGMGLRGSLFSDVDMSTQLELSRQVQQRQQQFAVAVGKMNETRLSAKPGEVFPVMQTFGSITEQSGNDQLSVQLGDSWKLLESITGESGRDSTVSGTPERGFLRDYTLNITPNSPEASRMRKRIERGSRRFLERLFLQHVEKTIVDQPHIARVGGVPSVFHKFRGYINVILARNQDNKEWNRNNFDYIEDVPCWAMVFFLVRAGLLNDANQYVKEHIQQFQKLDRGFANYLNCYATTDDRRLPKSFHDRIQGEYNNRIKHMDDSKDPFKPALYKIIGRCELAKRSMPTVLPTAEDWMWLQLVLCREIDRATEPAHEVFTLQDLQKNITQFGAKHFAGKGANVGLYFQMLLMCGLFEDAVAYLYSYDFIDAVHFAIALTYYALLRPTPDPIRNKPELKTKGHNNEPQINFPRLIGYYTRDFRTPSVSEAVDYLCLICFNGDIPSPVGSTHLQICHEALRELVLDTREFTKLLGDVRSDGTREKGAIETRLKLIKLQDQKEFLRTITEQAAVQADADGRASDAVLLYHLAEDYNTVIEILNKNLSNHIALSESAPGEKKLLNGGYQYHVSEQDASLATVDDPVQLAQNIMLMYQNAAIARTIQRTNRETCGALLQICQAQQLYKSEQWEACLELLDSLDALPLSAHTTITIIRRRAQNFNTLHETIARNIGTLLIMAVECCARLAEDLRRSQFSDAAKQQKIAELKARHRSAMLYAGMVQYKLPPNVYRYLNSREVE